MFERTKSGQQNRSLFLGVDYICYVEGGDGEDQEDGAHDITFWQSILKLNRPDLKVKCVPRGGKPILESLARDIIEKNIAAVLVAMDADYDHLSGETITDYRVLYTYGYSWENDAFTRENLPNIYCALCHCGHMPEQAMEHINEEVSHVLRALRWPARADHAAFRKGSSVLPRRSPGRVVKSSGGDAKAMVHIDRQEVLKLIKEAKHKPLKNERASAFTDIARFCVGHVFELAMIYILKRAAKLFGKKNNVSPDHIRDLCLSTFANLTHTGQGALFEHHQRQCRALPT